MDRLLSCLSRGSRTDAIMPEYEASHLRTEIDDVPLIRRTFGPKMSAQQLATQLVRDLILVGSIPLQVDCIDGWWLVSSGKDWLLSPGGGVTLRSFRHIVHFPEAGREACHSEILLSAFADVVVTRGENGEVTWISGDQERWISPKEILGQLMRDGRTVAFRNGDAHRSSTDTRPKPVASPD